MPFQIIRNDITEVKADAIVNTANPHPVIGSGTDSAIYHAAGESELLAERKKIGEIAPGHAVATPAFHLSATYIIHTVGPVWIDGQHGERDILRSCYSTSLSLASELGVKSIAFPLIATGVYGFPKDEALNIALSEIARFLLAHDMKVILVVFDKKAFELSGRLVGEIEEYIDEHSVRLAREFEYGNGYSEREWHLLSSAPLTEDEEPFDDIDIQTDEYAVTEADHLENIPLWGEAADDILPSSDILPDASGKSLDEMLGSTGETFQQRLLRLIDASGMDDVTVYKKANIDRKVFSRIRCKQDYRPKKKTAVAFAIALELDLPTTLDLLSRAEIAFSPSSRFDLIVTYFITNGIYDIYEINAALFKYGQPILGE